MQRTVAVPRVGLGLRLLMIAVGVAVFFWLSVEDNSTLPVAVLGTALAVVLALLRALSAWGGRSIRVGDGLLLLALFGALVGAAAALTVTGLMFFKTAWHSHIFPDYPLAMMAAMLTRTPVWALAGALIGAAGGLVWLALLPPASDA